MDDKKYNGWANYATWRINLEIFDGREWEVSDLKRMDVSELADLLKDEAEQAITNYGELPEGLAYDYAMAFISDVDWYEIARSIREDYGLGDDAEEEEEE